MSEDAQRTKYGPEEIVARLRTDCEFLVKQFGSGQRMVNDALDAADTIESLQAEVEKWKARYEGLLERVK